jgi:hypothetical protein
MNNPIPNKAKKVLCISRRRKYIRVSNSCMSAKGKNTIIAIINTIIVVVIIIPALTGGGN